MRNFFPPIRNGFGLFVLALLLFVPLGCADKEPEERQAFLTLLDEVREHKGVALPERDREARRRLGEYAEAYDLLENFQKTLSREAEENGKDLVALAETADLAGLAKAEKKLRRAAREAGELREIILALQKKTDAGKAALSLPADVAPVYDAVYAKIVTQPAAASAAVFAAIGAMFTSSVELLDFIGSRSRDMEIDGKNVNLKNIGLQEPLEARMADVREKAQALREAYAAMARAMGR